MLVVFFRIGQARQAFDALPSRFLEHSPYPLCVGGCVGRQTRAGRLATPLLSKMGACMSSESAEEQEKKKRSRAIDAALEEDSRRLRRECKILLLGTSKRAGGSKFAGSSR